MIIYMLKVLKKFFHILGLTNFLLGNFNVKNFDLTKYNLILKANSLDKKRNYYNIFISHLFPFRIDLRNLKFYKINIFPYFNNYDLPFIFLNKDYGKKLVFLYNEIVYNFYNIKILNEEIDFLNEKILVLQKIISIYSSEVLYEIQNTKSLILKRKSEIINCKKKIEENKKNLKLEFNYENLPTEENLYFIVPILNINEKKINNYIFKSYFYKKSLYELQNSFNNYWIIGNFQISYKKNHNISINYATNLKSNLNKSNLVKYNKFIEDILLSKKFVKNKINILKILKIEKRFLEINKKNLENYIEKYEENRNLDYIINLYKKKRELINIKKLQLQNLYKKVNNIFLIYLELIPLNKCKKIYEIPFNL